MSDNNTNVGGSNRASGSGNRSAPQGSSIISQRGFFRPQHNNQSWNKSNRNYKNNKTTYQPKGATEALGFHVFDCSTRKSLEGCNETLK